jgi:CHAD domain-containing protein
MPVTSTDDRELEWQFDALDLRPVARWLAAPNGWGDEGRPQVSPGSTFSQVDLYLDTDDWRFHRAGYALRIRRVGRRRGGEATLKGLDSAGSDRPGLRSRRELSEQLEAVDAAAAALAGGIVGRRVRAVAGKKPLLPLFEVRTRRRTFVVEADEAVWAELALDETAIHPPDGGAPARLRRVEIEASDAAHAALTSFVERLRSACALQPAGLSKYEAGLLSADLRPWGPERFGSTAVDPETTIGAVALAVLRRHFAALLAHEPGTRLGDDSEELHDMRVASRRLRAALSLFAEVLPETVLQVGDELRWVGETLGAVRDLDVQVEQLDEWLGAVPEADREALAELRTLLARQRSSARAAMLEALDSRRYEAFVSRFGRLLRARPQRRGDPGSAAALAVAPDLIERRFRSLRKAARQIGPESPAADYHRLRIRGKRLRYALEFLGDLYPGQTQPLVRRLVALQDLLGEHQDAEVAIARLRSLVGDGDESLAPETVFAMGAIAERYRQRAAALRAEFPAARARVTGRQWKALQDVLEEQRSAESEPGAGDAPSG